MVDKDQLQAALYWKAVKFHQNGYEIWSDWNKYNLNEHIYLKKYISYVLYGPPIHNEGDNNQMDDTYLFSPDGNLALINKIYNKIVDHGTQLHENNEIQCNLLYNFTYNENLLSNVTAESLDDIIKIYPIFKVKKNEIVENVLKVQPWYIDLEARAYKSWNDYLKNNNLPTCIMIIPKNGIYQADLRELWSNQESIIWLDTYIKQNNEITNILDLSNNVLSSGCSAVGVLSLFITLPACVVTSVIVGGMASGIWKSGRSLYDLQDRKNHDQSISIRNKEAFPSWLGVIENTLSIACFTSRALLTKAIRAGTFINKTAEIAHNTITVSNFLANSSQAVYKCVSMSDKYSETKRVEFQDVLSLSAHLLFCFHSFVNLKFTSDIIKLNQTQILKDYEDSLRSNRHRKEFRRLIRNTEKKVPNSVIRNTDIIRALNKIDDKDSFFKLLVRNRKLFVTSGTNVSFSNGEIRVDDLNLMDSSTFMSKLNSNLNVKNQINLPSNLHNKPNISVQNWCTSISSEVNQYIPSLNLLIDALQHSITMNTRQSEFFHLLIEACKYLVQEYIRDRTVNINKIFYSCINFVWKLFKTTLEQNLPNILIPNITCNPLMTDLLKEIIKNILNNTDWISAFTNYNNARDYFECDLSSTNTLDSDLLYFLNTDFEDEDNISIVASILEFILHSRDDLPTLVQRVLTSTGSKINEKIIISGEMIVLYEIELKLFLSRYPISFSFELTNLIHELSGLIVDLQNFNKKDIIFYKLITLCSNIIENTSSTKIFNKNILVDAMKFIWTFVNICFNKIMPHHNIFCNEFESLIIRIIIAIFHSQNTERQKWLEAYYYKLC